MRVSRRKLIQSLTVGAGGAVAGMGLRPARAGAQLTLPGAAAGPVRWSIITPGVEDAVPAMDSLDLAVTDNVGDLALQFLADHRVPVLSRMVAGRDYVVPRNGDDRSAIGAVIAQAVPQAVRKGQDGVYLATAPGQQGWPSAMLDTLRAIRFHFPYLSLAAEGGAEALIGLAPGLDYAILKDSATGPDGGVVATAVYEARSRALVEHLRPGGDGDGRRTALLAVDGWSNLADPAAAALAKRQVADGFSPCLTVTTEPA